MSNYKLKHQPRLESGRRIPRGSAIHEAVLHGLKEIARDERKSISWVVHEIVADYFQLDIMGEKKTVREFVRKVRRS
jgi:CRISPR/Cas system-associated exonuclease Cas4 (RecB family)